MSHVKARSWCMKRAPVFLLMALVAALTAEIVDADDGYCVRISNDRTSRARWARASKKSK